MSAENLATWKATTKPPCSSPGPGFHPWSSLVFHGMHTKREVAPPEATCLLMVCKGRGAELLPMCAVGMGLLHKPLHPAGTGAGLRPLPHSEFAPWRDWQDSSCLTWDRCSLVLPHSTLQEVTSEFGLVLSSACREPSLLLPSWWPYLHQAG